MKDDRHDSKNYEDDNKQNEPKVENDYKNIIEIEAPNPSTATPPIYLQKYPRDRKDFYRYCHIISKSLSCDMGNI